MHYEKRWKTIRAQTALEIPCHAGTNILFFSAHFIFIHKNVASDSEYLTSQVSWQKSNHRCNIFRSACLRLHTAACESSLSLPFKGHQNADVLSGSGNGFEFFPMLRFGLAELDPRKVFRRRCWPSRFSDKCFQNGAHDTKQLTS